MKTKLTPVFNDGMPREVAVAILSEPKAKLTNAFRKTCKRAMEKHYIAPPPQPLPEGADALRKWHTFSLAQLLKWGKRCKSRRRIAQDHYVRLVGLNEPTQAQKKLLASLSLQVAALDNMLDNIDDELKVRRNICAAVDKAHVEAFTPPFSPATRELLTAIRFDTQRESTH